MSFKLPLTIINKENNKIENKISNDCIIIIKKENVEECKNNTIQLNPNSSIYNIDMNNKQNIEEKEKYFNINEIKTSLIESLRKKKLGRKRKDDNSLSINNKYSDNSLRRKCKHIILKILIEFINKKISEIYNGNIGFGTNVKKLLNLNSKQNANVDVTYNKNFLNKTIGDIFSESISTSYSNYGLDHNKNLIKKLMGEEDINKKRYFNKLFNLTFLECLKHFRKSEIHYELIGLYDFDKLIQKYEIDSDYKNCLEYHFKNFEKIINNKKPRKKKEEIH